MEQGIRTWEEVRLSTVPFLDKNSIVGLRDLTAHLLGIATMLRGDNQRVICFSDMYLVPMRTLHTAGLKPWAVGIQIDQGKTIKNGTVSSSGFTRHRDVQVCPVFCA